MGAAIPLGEVGRIVQATCERRILACDKPVGNGDTALTETASSVPVQNP